MNWRTPNELEDSHFAPETSLPCVSLALIRRWVHSPYAEWPITCYLSRSPQLEGGYDEGRSARPEDTHRKVV